MFIIRAIYHFLLDTIQTILLAAAVFLVIYVFLFRPFQVSGASMYPNFEDSEYVLTNLINYSFEDPKKGDIIVFKAPNDPNKDYIKRVIGTPEDTVSIQNGKLYVNNSLLDERVYLNPSVETYGGSFLKEGQQVVIPQGEYFVLGDNRTASSDSREWGFIKKSDIIGKSFFVYWPPNKMRLVKNPFDPKK